MEGFSGQIGGRYRVLSPLGSGGMGSVYRAYDQNLGCEVAIKVVEARKFSPEALAYYLERFRREKQALVRLNHPNIVPILDFGEHQGLPFLVMRLMPGGTLKDRMGRPFPAQEAARLLIPIARALHYAHTTHYIYHRDIKPANILFNESGEPVISDFGIARQERGANPNQEVSLTPTGAGIGTPEYMAPEQIRGEEVDGRADVYSLGIVFYELVTGKKPFSATNPFDVYLMQISQPLPPPRSLVPGLPVEVEAFLEKALAKPRERRYASMQEVAVEFRNLTPSPFPSGKGRR